MPRALEQADGRWAWVVLLASLVTQALTVAFLSCIGVFFTDLQRDFQASNSETSWFPAIMGAMLNAGGEQFEDGMREERVCWGLGAGLFPRPWASPLGKPEVCLI